MNGRFAIYYAPEEGSELDGFGTAWIGRHAETGLPVEQTAPSGMEKEVFRRLTSSPRHYGFHGTLVPPFELRDGVSVGDLLKHADSVATELKPVDLEPLSVKEIGSFIALVPAGQVGVAGLAEACLRSFHAYRAEPLPAELARRRAKGLSPRQERLLADWWYPYVLEEYRFHLTLTNSIRDRELRREVLRHAVERTADLCRKDDMIRELCIFYQADRETAFSLIHRVPLGARQEQ